MVKAIVITRRHFQLNLCFLPRHFLRNFVKRSCSTLFQNLFKQTEISLLEAWFRNATILKRLCTPDLNI